MVAETLVVGLLVAVASLPVVTLVPAVAAGVRHLRRHLDGGNDSVRELLRDTGRTMRRLWVAGVALPAVLLVLAFNAWFVTANAIPAWRAVGVLAAALAAAVVVVALRFAASWSEDAGSWQHQVLAAADRARRDATGSLLLLAALGAAGVLVWMLSPMFVLVGGLVTFAALSVETRWERLEASPEERNL